MADSARVKKGGKRPAHVQLLRGEVPGLQMLQ